MLNTTAQLSLSHFVSGGLLSHSVVLIRYRMLLFASSALWSLVTSLCRGFSSRLFILSEFVLSFFRPTDDTLPRLLLHFGGKIPFTNFSGAPLQIRRSLSGTAFRTPLVSFLRNPTNLALRLPGHSYLMGRTHAHVSRTRLPTANTRPMGHRGTAIGNYRNMVWNLVQSAFVSGQAYQAV